MQIDLAAVTLPNPRFADTLINYQSLQPILGLRLHGTPLRIIVKRAEYTRGLGRRWELMPFHPLEAVMSAHSQLQEWPAMRDPRFARESRPLDFIAGIP